MRDKKVRVVHNNNTDKGAKNGLSLDIRRLSYPLLMYKAAQFPSTFYNSTVSCPFFVPLCVLFLLCTTLYLLIPHLS